MATPNKKFSPQAVFALKEALSVIYWKKEELRDFINLTVNNPLMTATINWDGLKRESAKELVDRMIARIDIYYDDLMNLILAVSDFTDFNHLKFWDADGSKTTRARQAVASLRVHTKGYIQITKEEEEARIRKVNADKVILTNKSISSELNKLNEEFKNISQNKDFQRRGYLLETFLNKLFLLYELDPKGSFKNYGEQIDGAFTHQGTDYLLEAKWTRQVNRADLATFCAKVESKLKNTIGLLVTMNGVTEEAIAPYFKSIIIMDGSDLAAVLEERVSFPDLLYKKRRIATETGRIYVTYFQL